MIPPCGTFAYTGVVPDGWAPSSDRLRLRDHSGAPPSPTGESLVDDRLVGLQPSLEIVDVGVTPDVRASPYTGSARPKVMLSRLILHAKRRSRATASAFSFCVDRSLIRCVQPGDTLHLAGTGCGGLALSVIRGGRLIAAAGAVTAVPCGESIRITVPEAVREAAQVFQRIDPEFEFIELPIQIQVGSECRVLYRGRLTLGDYEVFVEHGFYRGVPGTDECVALLLKDCFPSSAVICSAQLLEYQELSKLTRWSEWLPSLFTTR